MAKLVWTRRALNDLEGILEFIARDSDRYAEVFAERVLALVESIPKHPLLGAVVAEYQQEDLRERLFQNYRIVYRVSNDRVAVVTIVHGARLLPRTPPRWSFAMYTSADFGGSTRIGYARHSDASTPKSQATLQLDPPCASTIAPIPRSPAHASSLRTTHREGGQ